MIENTLGSLVALMGYTWIATQTLKNLPLLNRVPQKALAVVLAEVGTVLFWLSGQITLDGADPSTTLGWMLALFYGLVAVSMAMQAHDTGSDPKKVLKRLKDGKPLEG